MRAGAPLLIDADEEVFGGGIFAEAVPQTLGVERLGHPAAGRAAGLGQDGDGHELVLLLGIGPPKTRAGIRTVPLPQVVVDIFKGRITGRTPDQPAITSPDGGMLRSNNWRRHTHWNKTLKKTDLAPLTIHDLRHTYASLARKSGADLRYVQETMGHSTPTVTANIYS